MQGVYWLYSPYPIVRFPSTSKTDNFLFLAPTQVCCFRPEITEQATFEGPLVLIPDRYISNHNLTKFLTYNVTPYNLRLAHNLRSILSSWKANRPCFGNGFVLKSWTGLLTFWEVISSPYHNHQPTSGPNFIELLSMKICLAWNFFPVIKTELPFKFPFVAYCLLLVISCWLLILKVTWKFGWLSCFYQGKQQLFEIGPCCFESSTYDLEHLVIVFSFVAAEG